VGGWGWGEEDMISLLFSISSIYMKVLLFLVHVGICILFHTVFVSSKILKSKGDTIIFLKPHTFSVPKGHQQCNVFK
jgi:hypothetical protein